MSRNDGNTLVTRCTLFVFCNFAFVRAKNDKKIRSYNLHFFLLKRFARFDQRVCVIIYERLCISNKSTAFVKINLCLISYLLNNS